MWPGRSRSATSGSRRSCCRSGSGRPARPKQLPVLTMVTGYSRWLSAVLIPSRRGGGPVRRLVAADRRAGCGAAGAGLGRGGRDRPLARRRSELTARLPGVPRHAGHEGAHLQAGRPGGQGPDRTGPRLPGDARSCPAAASPAPADFNTQLQGWLAVVNTPPPAGAGVRADRPGRRGPGTRCWRCRRSPPATGWRSSTAAAAGSLRPPGLQRLLGAPGGDRPPDRGRRRPGPGPGVLRRAGWSPTTTGSGPGTRRSPTPTTAAAAKRCAGERVGVLRPVPSPRSSTGRWPTTTPPSASTLDGDGARDGRPQDRATTASSDRPGPDRRGRVPDPGVEGTDAARVGAAAGRAGPHRVLDP